MRGRGDGRRGAWTREPGTVVLAGDPPTTAPFAIVSESDVAPVPLEWMPHAHDRHELVWVRGGTMTTRVDDLLFTVPPGHGLWLPAGVVHAGRLTADAVLHDALFAPDRTPVAFDGPTIIEMTPVLAALLAHLEGDDLDDRARARAEAVVFDVLRPAAQQFTLRLPGDPRIDPIARALVADPGDPRSLDDWARVVDLSERTVTRVFRRTTGLSFAQWRQALRVHHALRLLSTGCDVGETSDRLGYAQPSTFIAAFRRVMGTTPGVFAGNVSDSPY